MSHTVTKTVLGAIGALMLAGSAQAGDYSSFGGDRVAYQEAQYYGGGGYRYGGGHGYERDHDYRDRGPEYRGRMVRSFDEGEYLSCNRDVLRAVRRGQMESGYAHWLSHGRREGRALRC